MKRTGGAGHEAGALELGERVRRGVLGHSGERGHVPDPDVVLPENRQRARHRAAGTRQALEAEQHRGAHRVRAQGGHTLALASVGSIPSARTSLTSCSSRNGLPPVA